MKLVPMHNDKHEKVSGSQTPPSRLPESEALLTVSEVADKCRVSKRSVQRWLAHEGLSWIRLPGRSERAIVRIRKEDLDNWIERRVQDPFRNEEKTFHLGGMRFLNSDRHRPGNGQAGRKRS